VSQSYKLNICTGARVCSVTGDAHDLFVTQGTLAGRRRYEPTGRTTSRRPTL
jgi:hypothetical protein